MYTVEIKNIRYTVRYHTECKTCYDLMIRYGLTLKEAKTYHLIKEGKSYSDIRDITGLSDATVRYQLAAIKFKTKEVTPKRKVIKQARVVLPAIVKPLKQIKPIVNNTIELPIGVNKLCLK